MAAEEREREQSTETEIPRRPEDVDATDPEAEVATRPICPNCGSLRLVPRTGRGGDLIRDPESRTGRYRCRRCGESCDDPDQKERGGHGAAPGEVTACPDCDGTFLAPPYDPDEGGADFAAGESTEWLENWRCYECGSWFEEPVARYNQARTRASAIVAAADPDADWEDLASTGGEAE